MKKTKRKLEQIKQHGLLMRSSIIDRSAVDEDARTVEIAFSSDAKIERWFGHEILDHKPSSVRLERLRDGGAVLSEHDRRQSVGVVETVSIENGKGRAVVRFSKNPAADELFNDVKDGIKRHVSVGYRVHKAVLEESSDQGETYRAIDWEPYEVSIVAIPADISVGVGRNAGDGETFSITLDKGERMTDKTKKRPDQRVADDGANDQDSNTVDVVAVTNETRTAEIKRIKDLTAAGERYAGYGGVELAERAISDGSSVDQFRLQIADNLPNERQVGSGDAPEAASEIGLDPTEARRYSMVRAINAAVTNDWSNAGFERECSLEIAERLDRDARGFFVPMEVQNRVMTATTGSDLIGTDHMAGSFIEALRPESVVIDLGATILDGLVGNVTIPKQNGNAAFEWLSDDDDVSDSDPAFGNVALTPKTVAGSVPMSRRLLKQSSPSIDGLVQRDLVRGAALAIDLAALLGTGADNQPLGVVNQTGINVQTLAAAGQPTLAELVGFETKVGEDNALNGSLAYVTTSGVRGYLKTSPTDAGSGIMMLKGDQANGYKVAMSNQLAANSILFGNWNDVIIGMWGVLDIMPDTAAKAASGGLVLRVFQDADVAIRHAQSFCKNG